MVTSKRLKTLEEIEEQLQQNYPQLSLEQEGKDWFVRGVFPIKVEGKLVDNFLVEIWIPPDYPEAIPWVRELAGRIPVTANRHAFKDEDRLCLFLEDERWRYWPLGSDFIAFLDKPLSDFFRSQVYYETTGKWPYGERGHGIIGVIEYYREELGEVDLATIAKSIEYLSKGQPKGHWLCYCGSGRKMRYCHFDKIMELHDKISPKIAQKTLRYFSWKSGAYVSGC